MGPAPAVAEVRRAVRGLLMNPKFTAPGAGESGIHAAGRRVLVACSGGADSLALAAATAFVAPRLGLAAGLVTVDHGLQDGSAAQAARVAALGYELGLDPVETVRVEVGRAGGPEAAARTARYTALDGVAAALDAHVLLGHTLDDQAETVLLGLGRGSGPRSIAGMRAAGPGPYLRPLLGVRRATTAAACAALGLVPWTDPHNADPAYRRVRLRREVLPLLEDVLGGGVAGALARTASQIQDDLDALDGIAARHLADQQALGVGNRHLSLVDHGGEGPDAGRQARGLDGGTLDAGTLDAGALAEQPRAVRTRVLRGWAHAAGAGPLTAAHLAALDALVTGWHGQGPADLPGGVRVRRVSGRLEVHPPPEEPLESPRA